MAENPPLNRLYVLGYAANDRDYPLVSMNLDPRVAGYKVPEDLSTCPDKRYPNHVFTGAQPLSGDERVRHVWEILPSPWVPFTRYDDDLGPIQGRRRSVENTGQQASLASDTKISYEGREGSAIVSTELEETWSIKTDEDGNSLFPIKDRDFYDASRGPVQERRQLFVPTGEEEASLENVDGIITQTSYEPYNEFLSVKIVQTYKVNGPLLVGSATNNEGQLTTVTIQRKGAKDYVPPNPTATRTVESNREDAESLVERIVDAPMVFAGASFSAEKADIAPEKFRASVPVETTESSLEGTAAMPQLGNISGRIEISKSEQQVTEFIKRVRETSRETSVGTTLVGQVFTRELGGGIATVTETWPSSDFVSSDPEFGVISDEIENLGNGTKTRRKVKLTPKVNIFPNDSGGYDTELSMPLLTGQDYDQELDLVIPYKRTVSSANSQRFAQGNRKRVSPIDILHSEVTRYDVEDVQNELDEYYWEIPDMIDISLPNKLKRVLFNPSVSGSSGNGSGFGDTYSWSYTRRGAAGGSIAYDIEEGFSGTIPTIRAIFFLPKGQASPQNVLGKLNGKYSGGDVVKFWPNVRPQSHLVTISETSTESSKSFSVSFNSGSESESSGGSFSRESITIPPTIHPEIVITSDSVGGDAGSVDVTPRVLEETSYAIFPTGPFLYRINATPYRFSYVRIDALVVDIQGSYV